MAHLTVDRAGRETLVHLPEAEGTGARWVDWLARVYFGSRLLSDGWRLYASLTGLNRPGEPVLLLEWT